MVRPGISTLAFDWTASSNCAIFWGSREVGLLVQSLLYWLFVAVTAAADDATAAVAVAVVVAVVLAADLEKTAVQAARHGR